MQNTHNNTHLWNINRKSKNIKHLSHINVIKQLSLNNLHINKQQKNKNSYISKNQKTSKYTNTENCMKTYKYF